MFIGGFLKDFYTIDVMAPAAAEQVKDSSEAYVVARASMRIVSTINWLSFFVILLSMSFLWKKPVLDLYKKLDSSKFVP